MNAQKRIFIIVKGLKTTGREIVSSVAVSSVDQQRLIFLPGFCTETEQCGRLTDIYKRVSSYTEQCEPSLRLRDMVDFSTS